MAAARRLIRLFAAVAALICAACAAPAPGATVPEPASGADPTVLVLWHAWPQPADRALIGQIDRFNRSQTAVQVVVQARPMASLVGELGAAIDSGVGPHVAIIPSHSLGELAEDGHLRGLDGLLSSSETARLIPAAVGSGQIAGPEGPVTYGLPISYSTLALYYNRANFAADPPADLEALLATARGLTDTRSDPRVWGLAYTLSLDRTMGYFYAFGGRIFDADGRVTLGLEGRAGAEAWLSWLAAMREDQRLLASADGIAVDSALLRGEALMAIDWSHALPTYQQIWPGSLGVAPLPGLPGADQPPPAYVQSDLLVLNVRATAAEQAAAASLARHLIDAPAQGELLLAGRQPALGDLDLSADSLAASPELLRAAEAFRAQARAGIPIPNTRQANQIAETIIADMQASVLRRILSPAQAVDSADASLRARLGR